MSEPAVRPLQGRTKIGSYFARIGSLGTEIKATNCDGRPIEIDSAISDAVDISLAVKSRRGRVMFVGNGGSAAIASHMTADWMKNGGFSAQCFNDGSQLTCIGNDLGFEQIFSVPIEQHGRDGDLLIALSSSGKSPDILAAVALARHIKINVITMSGFEVDNPLRRLGDVNFWVPDGHYGFVEIAHLTICHAILDIAMGWQRVGDQPVGTAYR